MAKSFLDLQKPELNPDAPVHISQLESDPLKAPNYTLVPEAKGTELNIPEFVTETVQEYNERMSHIEATKVYTPTYAALKMTWDNSLTALGIDAASREKDEDFTLTVGELHDLYTKYAPHEAGTLAEAVSQEDYENRLKRIEEDRIVAHSLANSGVINKYLVPLTASFLDPANIPLMLMSGGVGAVGRGVGVINTVGKARAFAVADALGTNVAIDVGMQDYWKGGVSSDEMFTNLTATAGLLAGVGAYSGAMGWYSKHSDKIAPAVQQAYKKTHDAFDNVFTREHNKNVEASKESTVSFEESITLAEKQGLDSAEAKRVAAGVGDATLEIVPSKTAVVDETLPIKPWTPIKGERITETSKALNERLSTQGDGTRVTETAHANALDRVVEDLDLFVQGVLTKAPDMAKEMDISLVDSAILSIFARTTKGRGWTVVFDSDPKAVSHVSMKEGIITIKARKKLDKNNVSSRERIGEMTAGELRELMHEVAHANLGILLDAPKDLLTKQQLKDAEELRALLNSIPKHIIGKKHQGSMHERAARALSNKAVQQHLMTQKAPEGTLWQKFKNKVASLFGIASPTQMDQLMRLLKRQALPDNAQNATWRGMVKDDIHYFDGMYKEGLTQKEQSKNFNEFVEDFVNSEQEPVKQKQIAEIEKMYTPYIKVRPDATRRDVNMLDYFISAGMRAALSDNAKVRAVGSMLLDTPTAVGRQVLNAPHWYSRTLGSYSSRYAPRFQDLFMSAMEERGYPVSRFRRFFNISGGFGEKFQSTAAQVYRNAFELATLRRNIELANSDKGSPDMAQYKGMVLDPEAINAKYTKSEQRLADLWDSFVDDITASADNAGVDKANAIRAMTTKGYMRRKWNIPMLNKLKAENSPVIQDIRRILFDNYVEAIYRELKQPYLDPEYALKKQEQALNKMLDKDKADSEATGQSLVKSMSEYKAQYDKDLNDRLRKSAERLANDRVDMYLERILTGEDLSANQRILSLAKDMVKEAQELGIDSDLDTVFRRIEDELNDMSRTEFDILRSVNGTRLIDFMDVNMMSNMGSMIREYSGRIALAKIGLKTSTSVDNFKALLGRENLPEADKQLFSDYLDFYIGTLDQGNSTLATMMSQIAVTAQMGRIGFNQAGDMLNTAIIVGSKNAASLLPERYADLFGRLLSKDKSLTKSEINDLNEFLSDFAETSGDLLGDEHLSRLNPYFNTTDPYDLSRAPMVAMQGISQGFGYMTGAYLIQRSTQKITFETLARNLCNLIENKGDISKGLPRGSEAYQRMLNEFGLTDNDMVVFKEMIDKYASRDAEGNIQKLNMSKWDPEYFDKFEAVIRREATHARMQTHTGGTPWGLMKSGSARIFMQYRTTGLMAAETQLAKGVALGMRQYAPVMAMQATHTALLYLAKTLAIAAGISNDSKRDEFLDNRFDFSTPENLLANLTAYMNLLPWAGWFPDGLGLLGVVAGITDPKTVIVPPALSQLEKTLQSPSRIAEGIYAGDSTKVQQGFSAMPLGVIPSYVMSLGTMANQ